MHKHRSTITTLIALVWLVNGLICKLLNLVPRHQLIVARILGIEYAVLFTKTIGVLEIGMALWIFSRIKTKWCAIAQIIIVLSMNVLEFSLVPDILLFGKANMFIALLFCVIVYYNEFLNKPKSLA
jgi:DoxX-like family